MRLDIRLKTPRKSERVACAVEPEIREMLRQYAEENEVKESEAMRFILGDFLSRYVKKSQARVNNNPELEVQSA